MGTGDAIAAARGRRVAGVDALERRRSVCGTTPKPHRGGIPHEI